MNLEPIESVLANPTRERVQALLDDEETVFWVDWRQEDESIADACEGVLQTGALSGELVKVDSKDGYEIHVSYRGRRLKVPLTYSGADRHVTICSLNEILRPDFEIRFCLDSNGNDTLAFLPLASDQWAALEQRYGAAVGQRFYRIAASPNLFTDSLSFPNHTEPPAQSASDSSANRIVLLHKYPEPLDLRGKDLISLLNSRKEKVAGITGPLEPKSKMQMAERSLRELTLVTGEVTDEVHEFPNATFGSAFRHLVLQFHNDRLVNIQWASKGPAITPPPRHWFRRWLGL